MMRLRVLGAVIALAGAMATAGTASAAAPRVVAPQSTQLAEIMTYYGFVNRGQHFCLDAENDANGNPYQNGDKVQMWTCLDDVNQQWIINTVTDTIVNKMSGKCLDAKNEPPSPTPWNNGDPMQLWDCNGTGQQMWAEGTSNYLGFYEVSSDDTLNTMCLDGQTDTNNDPNYNGDRVQLWQCSGQDQQMWTFVYLV